VALRDVFQEVDRAVESLRQGANNTPGWSDQQRIRFDEQRLEPLLHAGEQLIACLRRSNEEIDRIRNALETDQ
jgi:hypothetical protein